MPEDLKLSSRILSNAGFGVSWIEARKDIDRKRASLERDIKLREARLQALKKNLARTPAYLQTTRSTKLQAELGSSIEFFTRTTIALNRRIDDYNLVVPSTTVQTSRVDPKGLVGRLNTQFASNGEETRNS